MKKKNLTISIDDGHPLDLKAAEILDKKGISTTFYIPIKNITGRPTLSKKQIKYLSQNHLFTIGSHTYSHANITMIAPDKAEEEIRTGKEALEDIIGKKVTTFAWPWGRFNSRLINTLSRLGFKDCRGVTLINLKDSYKKSFLWFPNFQIVDLSIASDFKYFVKKFDIYTLTKVCLNFKLRHLDFITLFKQFNFPYHFWFHSWEIEAQGIWNTIKSL